MYKEFFNLKTKPFELVPNPDFLFMSKSHKRAMTYLDYGVKEKIGFILLTGEIGSGKTTIVRNLIKKMNGRVVLSNVINTNVSSEQLISMINDDFGLDVAGKDKITLLRELNDFLIQQYADNYQPVLIIDEAQNLTPELLEEIRMLSNLETDTSKLLQIILVGQPELDKILAQPELRQLRQRISISSHINPLTREDTEGYILHRLEVAGNREAVGFTDGVIDIIHDFSRGIPRLINIICDFLMLSAYVDKTRDITIEMTKELVDDLQWKDAIPDNYISDNDSVLSARGGSKDIINRIEMPEEEVFKNIITQTEKAEILQKLSEVERQIKNVVTGSEKKDIINRIERIEEESFKNIITQTEKAEILQKLSEAERRTKSPVTISEKEVVFISRKFEDTVIEVRGLKKELKQLIFDINRGELNRDIKKDNSLPNNFFSNLWKRGHS